MDYVPGATVLIESEDRLKEALLSFSPNLDCISPLNIADIADRYATIVDIIQALEDRLDIGDFALLVLDNNQDICLPLSAFRPVLFHIDEPDESYDHSHQLLQKITSKDNSIARTLAAECIQSAYRNYRQCKKEIKVRKLRSSEKLVMNMAAETIANQLRKIVSKSKLKSNNSSLKEIFTKEVTSLVDSSSKVLEFSRISVSEVSNVSWNENNNLYILLELKEWLYRLQTLRGAGNTGTWDNLSISLDYSILESIHKNDYLKVYVYHECLAIEDKLVGVCNISISKVLQSLSNSNIYSETLYDTVNIIKRKPKGKVSINWKLTNGSPTISNWNSFSNIKDPMFASTISDNLEASSAVTKYIDINNGESINGITHSQILALSNNLNNWENKIEDGTATSLSSNLPISRDISKDISSFYSAQDSLPLETRSRISYISEERLNRLSKSSNVPTRSKLDKRETSQPVRRKSTHSTLISKILTHVEESKSSNQNISQKPHEPFRISHTIETLFDQAFYVSLLRISSQFTLKIKEFILLLDSLDLPIKADYLNNEIEPKLLPFNDDQIILPVNSPISFATVAIEMIIKYSLMKENDLKIVEILINEEKSRLAIKYILNLIKGPYFPIRDLVYLACGGSSKSKDEIEAHRPRRLSEYWCRKLLITMKLSGTNTSVESFSAYLDSLNFSGQELLSTGFNQTLFDSLKIKANILRTRFLVYQSTLVMLDGCWDRGLRPSDPISENKKNKKKPVKSAWGEPTNPETYSKSHISRSKSHETFSVIENSNQMVDAQSTISSTIISSAMSNMVQNKESSFQLCDANDLFHSYVSLNRAFGWGYSISNLTTLANSIGGFYGTLSDKNILEESTDFMDWITIEFPSSNEKDMILSVLNTISKSIPKILEIQYLNTLDNIQLTVKVARTCYHAVTLNGGSCSNNMMLKNEHVQENEIELGMKLEVKSENKIERFCQRFEWYDRPPVDVLKALANQKVEVVSLADLKSKKRVGVKCVSPSTGDIIMDALPIEALMLINKSTLDQDNTIENQYQINENINPLKKKKKSGKVRRKSIDKTKTVNQNNNFTKDNQLDSTINEVLNEIPQIRSNNNTNRIKSKIRELILQSLSEDSNNIQEKRNIELNKNITMLEDKKKIYKAKSQSIDMSINPDECEPPIEQNTSNLQDSREAKIERPRTNHKISINLKTQKYQPPESTNEQIYQNNNQNSNVDYSWLKPVDKSIVDFDFKSLPKSVDRNQISESNKKNNEPDQNDKKTPDKASIKYWQPVLDQENIIYTKGVYNINNHVKASPSPPKNTSRPGSANPQNRHNNNLVSKVNESPEFNLMGHGYDQDMKSWKVPAEMEFPEFQNENKIEEKEKTSPNKKKETQKNENWKDQKHKLFEFNERKNIEEKANWEGIMISGLGNEIQKKSNDLELKLEIPTPKETPISSNGKPIHNFDSATTVDRNINFDVKVKKSPRLDEKEEIYYNREMIRSAREANFQQDHLKRELRRLGINPPSSDYE